MAQTSTRTERYEGTRITFESNQPFDAVLSKLYSSIGTPDSVDVWPSIARSINSTTAEAREAVIAKVNSTIGPHGFMIFQDINHGAWIPLFGVGDGRKARRIILGNPLIAITMLKRDLTAGLAVPVEVLVLEKEKSGGTDVIYQLPSGLIAGLNKDKELVEAVGALDVKLEELVRFAVL